MQACAWTGECQLPGCADKCIINTHIGGQAISEMFAKKLIDAIDCPLMTTILNEVVTQGGVSRKIQVRRNGFAAVHFRLLLKATRDETSVLRKYNNDVTPERAKLCSHKQGILPWFREFVHRLGWSRSRRFLIIFG
jgi:GrpB-like predicted nucleotidyltransferase (UPF0157 family)